MTSIRSPHDYVKDDTRTFDGLPPSSDSRYRSMFSISHTDANIFGTCSTGVLISFPGCILVVNRLSSIRVLWFLHVASSLCGQVLRSVWGKVRIRELVITDSSHIRSSVTLQLHKFICHKRPGFTAQRSSSSAYGTRGLQGDTLLFAHW